ncbi:MAG: dihydroneopterin aldolase [Chloroflexota bacterium]
MSLREVEALRRMDRIILADIDVYAYGGVTEPETLVGQRYRVTLSMELDLRAAEKSDDLADTVSYADAHRIVVDTIRGRRFHLLESMAGEVAQRLLCDLHVDGVTVELQKLLPPIDGVVGYAAVVITRTRGAESH